MVRVTKMENILKRNSETFPKLLAVKFWCLCHRSELDLSPHLPVSTSSPQPSSPHPIACVYTKDLTLPIPCPTHPAPLSTHQTVPPAPQDTLVPRPQPAMGHCGVGHLSPGMAVLVAPWWSCCHLHHASRQRGMQAAETLAGTPVAFSQ